MHMTAAIVMRDVSIGYGAEPIVRHVDVEVARGELVVLLGENGSGKSTLVKGLLGLAPDVQGDVELFGEPTSPSARRRIGYVPQRTTVGGGVPVSVREVVASGRTARRRWFMPATAEDHHAIDAALDAVRLRDRSHDVLATLSGGQQRRALIARALAASPDLLVMDEPTAGVDAANVELLAESLGRWKDEGLTLLIVAHGTGPLRPLIDRALVMHQGRLVYDGPPTGPLVAQHDDHVLDDHAPTQQPSFVVPDEPKLGRPQ